MSKTTDAKNGVSRSPPYSHGPCNSESNHPTNQGKPNDNFLDSSKPSSVADMSKSKSKLWEAEVFQSREVLLRLLQPPASRLSSDGFPVPHYMKGMTRVKSDVCELHCSRCLGFPPIGRITNGDVGSETLNDNCDYAQRKGGQWTVSTMQPAQNRRGLQTVASQCSEEDRPRKGKSTVFFPPHLRCQTGESGDHQPCLEPSISSFRTPRCQHIFAEVQQHSRRNNCSRRDSFADERDLAPPYKRTQTKDTKVVNLRKGSHLKQRDNLSHVCPDGRCYHGYRARICRASASREDIADGHSCPATETSGQVNRLYSERMVDDVLNRFEERSHTASSSSKQDKASESSGPVPESQHRQMPLSGDDSALQSQSREKRNSSQEKIAKESHAPPCWPNKSTQRDERSVEECTPVIVHCYSLSEHGLSSKPQLEDGRDIGMSHAVNKEIDPRFPGRHSSCTNQKISSNTNDFQHAGDVPHTSSAHRQRGKAHIRPKDTKQCRDVTNPSEQVLQHVEGRDYHWLKKYSWHGKGPLVKIHDSYEEKRILVEKLQGDVPCSVEDEDCQVSWNIPDDGRRKVPHKGSVPGVLPSQFAGAQIYQMPSCVDGPFGIHVCQQETAIGSKKRKSRQPRPQRLVSDDLAHFHTRNDDIQKFQFGKERSEEPFEHEKRSRQTSRPYSNAYQEARQDEEIPKRKDKGHCRHDVRASVSHHLNRCDNHNVENPTLSRSRIFRRGVSSTTFPPWCNSFERTVKTAQLDSLFPRAHLQDVPSSVAIGRYHRLENDFSTSSRRKTETTTNLAESSLENEVHASDNPISAQNGAQKQWHVPAWMTGRGKYFETYVEREPGVDNSHKTYSPGVRMAYSDPTRRNMPTDSGKTFPRASNFECSRHCTTKCHLDSSGYQNIQPKWKNASIDVDQPATPSPDDHVSVGVSSFDNPEESMREDKNTRSLQNEHWNASSEKDAANAPTEVQNISFSENQIDFFHQSQRVHANLEPTVKERKFVCRFCCKKFAHFSTLQNHLRTHTGDKPFQCKFCSRRFAQSGVLKAHLRTHTGDKPFLCVYCRKTFAQSTTLTNHLRTHTGQKPYMCNYCGKSFSQPSTLRKHELSHTKERPYPCKFCGKAFAQQSTLTNHLRSHTGQRPYKCQFCEKSFAQLSTLDRHLRLHSTVSVKPHQCQYCSKSFSYFSNLASHMQVHQEEQRTVIE
ncbi:uncharacterized protein [Montipora foliosa]|uniref:uncharacterized protein n=1 Tax=Montipora foliosa TaxID=591990 RepID=UPI0035F17DC6